VLSVLPFTDEDEAVRIANDTEYGLAATVWTSDIKRAMRLTRAIRAGTVGINGYQLEPHAAFGGYRQSGLGREGGRHRGLHRAQDRAAADHRRDDVTPR
jgi:aldehyde dehydrogenase (NAD+)